MIRWRRLLVLGTAVSAPALAQSSPPEAPVGIAGPPRDDAALAVESLDRNIATLDHDERADAAEESRVGGDVARVHARIIEHGRAYYRLTRVGLLPIGGGFTALVSYAMHVERLRHLVTGELREEERLHARAETLRADLERVTHDRAALSAQRDALRSAQSAVEDEHRRDAAFERAFETSTGAGNEYVAVFGASGGVAPEMPAGGFASARGRLVFPVAARGDVRPARREGTSGPGLEIHAAAGSVVRAVFAARVAFADRYGPYGRIVILDHGDHYYTVSGNLAEMDVKIGQDVGAGDRIGTVGDDGSGAMLYFEVRHGSQAVAPSAWLGL